MELDKDRPIVRSRIFGVLTPVVEMAPPNGGEKLAAVTLAFASGECGLEQWGGLSADRLVSANVPVMSGRSLPYVISTGGEGNVFTCESDAGMERFISRYESPFLKGFDFDIEAGQTQADIVSLVQRVAVAQRKRPHLRFSFTLATFAASDGSGASLNATGAHVMQALQATKLTDYFINLMVMNYGPAEPANCVVRAGRCDMAASAQQAVHNLHRKYGLPFANIEVTAMLGVNDVTSNVFTPQDATALAQFARASGLAGLHYWSLDRDKPCEGGAVAVSPQCSSLNDVTELAYLRAFAAGLK